MAPWLKFCSFFFSLTACFDGPRLAVSAGGTSGSGGRKGPAGDACGWKVREREKERTNERKEERLFCVWLLFYASAVR